MIYALFLGILPQGSTQSIILLIVVMIMLVAWGGKQLAARKRMLRELDAMGSVKWRDLEFDMVLRAMKLCTWHIDVETMMLKVDSDYTESGETDPFFEDLPFMGIIAKVAEWNRERVAKAMYDLCNGKTDEYHMIYERAMPLTGDTFWTESFATVSERLPDGSPKTIVGTTMDIDQQKKLEKALTQARNKAEESDRLKTDFLNNISHEIRTPLNAIVGFTDVIDSVEGDERKQVSALVKENAETLLRIFEDMVNMANIEAKVTIGYRSRKL